MKHGSILFLALSTLFVTGCGSQWSVSDAKFFKYQNHDVRLAAKMALSQKAKPKTGSDGVNLELRLYTGNYGAILTEVSQKVGETLESEGTENVPVIGTIAISEFRLGGTPNTYQDFCAEFRLERSNFPDWTRIGCVNFTDTPSESPTGGLAMREPEIEGL